MYAASKRWCVYETRNCGLIKWTVFDFNSNVWSQASESNRASAAYETAEDASPRACNLVANLGSAPGARCLQGNAALLRDPQNVGPQPAIRTQKPLFLRQRGMPRFPSVGVKLFGAIARFRSGTSAFTARDADHYTTIAIVVGQGGWLRSSGLRLPTPALFQLSYTLNVETPCSRRIDAGPLLRRRGPRLRNQDAPSVAFSSR